MTDTASGQSERAIELTEPADDRSDSFWRFGFPALMAVSVIVLVALIVVGRDVILQSTEGAREAQVTDPRAPGWEALTESTPVLLVVHRNDARKLQSLTVLSLTGANAGGVMSVPLSTTVPGTDRPLSAFGETDQGARDAVEKVLGVAVGEMQSVGSSQWRELVQPVGTLTVSNPDDVFGSRTPGGTVTRIFPKGEMPLPPDDVGRYLESSNAGESDLNRLVRHGAFWRSWFDAVRRSGRAGAVPGAADMGLARFVPALANISPNAALITTLPVQKQSPARATAGADEVFGVLSQQLQVLLARLVPFPEGPAEETRVRVRILDGVGTLDHGLVAAPALVGAGAQIDRIGNASAFGAPVTKLTYTDDADAADARALASALGVGEIVKDAVPTEAGGPDTDVTVTLGRDFIEKGRAGPLGSSAPTTGGSGG